MANSQAPAQSEATYVLATLSQGVLDQGYHFKPLAYQDDIDGLTCHVIVSVETNDCAALIEVLHFILPYGLTIASLHHLKGKYRDCVELDITTMLRRRKFNAKPPNIGHTSVVLPEDTPDATN